jgi:hypothetical protein
MIWPSTCSAWALVVAVFGLVPSFMRGQIEKSPPCRAMMTGCSMVQLDGQAKGQVDTEKRPAAND